VPNLKGGKKRKGLCGIKGKRIHFGGEGKLTRIEEKRKGLRSPEINLCEGRGEILSHPEGSESPIGPVKGSSSTRKGNFGAEHFD